MDRLQTFNGSAVTYIDSQNIKDGVDCDVYAFKDDINRDLGIVKVKKGCVTPRQKILKGNKTIEGFLEGRGLLTVETGDGNKREYNFPNDSHPQELELHIGDVMQWQALDDLVFYEVCYPPYANGRFENID